MKKTVCILLSIVFMLSVIPVCAAENGKELRYKDVFCAAFQGVAENDTYDELYYHYQGEQVDWALVYGSSIWVGSAFGGGIVCNRYIVSPWQSATFETGYGIYCAAENTFYDLVYVDEEAYDGLSVALDALNIGTKIGDMDLDNELTVNDATEIQAYLAEFPVDHVCYSQVMDVTKDSKTTIADVTALQRTLAGIE